MRRLKLLLPGLRIKRWFGLTLIGLVVLALGLAYLFVVLYRTVPLPEEATYLTLQFVPRWLRGLIFVLAGAAVTALALIRLNLALAAPLANWQHDQFFIVHELYTAVDWSFLGTKDKSADVEFTGKGAQILSFLSAGATLGLKSSGSIEVKILGQGGAIAQNVARVRRDGQIVFDV